jgi:hypothetical protein
MHLVLFESPWWVGVHQGGLVMFKPGFCFDPVINLGIDNISNDSSGLCKVIEIAWILEDFEMWM